MAAADDDEVCVQLMREAMAMHLDGLREDGEPAPSPTAVASLLFPAA